jgi:hypothetical protein
MNRAGLIPAILAAIALLSLTPLAQGQARRNDSRPRARRPTFSPYLQLFRDDAGPLPAYQQFVQPRIRQQQFNQQGRQAVQQLQRRLQQFQADTAPPTGAASQFRNSSVYFRNNLQFFQTHRPRR